MKPEIVIGGIYRHFKGNLYVLDNGALHTETLEPLIIYHSVDNPSKVWARPVEMFFDEVGDRENPTGQKYRFELV